VTDSLILAGDVGGTKALLGCFTVEGGRLVGMREQRYSTTDHADFSEVINDFLGEDRGRVSGACFGVAAPIQAGKGDPPNLAWTLDAGDLQRRTALSRIDLINDMIALAHGLGELPPESFASLNPRAVQSPGNAAIIAPGTGLGEAMLFWDGERWRPSPSEGGHCDFAPNTKVDEALMRFTQREFEHVSWERFVSGPGLFRIYRFLCYRRGVVEPSWITERMLNEEPGGVIGELGIAGRCPICVEALAYFARLLGAEAGNLALKTLALGGVYIGGGMVPKILTALKREQVLFRAFVRKGRYAEMLATLPVSVVLDERAPLLGAARYAADATGDR